MDVQTWDSTFSQMHQKKQRVSWQVEATLGITYVIGKRRVAPIRYMKILKLELQAAVYGVCLRKQILSKHVVRIDKINPWTNSSTVLKWLQAAHKKQQVFLVNRATEILEQSSMEQWRYFNGVENHAHIGTQGVLIEGLNDSVWLIGRHDGKRWTKVTKAVVSGERNWTRASYQFCSHRD